MDKGFDTFFVVFKFLCLLLKIGLSLPLIELRMDCIFSFLSSDFSAEDFVLFILIKLHLLELNLLMF